MVQAQACLYTVLAQLLGWGVRSIGQESSLCCCVTPTHSACNQHLLFSKMNNIISVLIRETKSGHSPLQSGHHHTAVLKILQENCFVILSKMAEVRTQ
jgi:hypothetical protein